MNQLFLTINGKDEGAFLRSYNHDYKSVSDIGLTWESLVEIHDYYKGIIVNKLEIEAQELFLKLKTIKGAHSVKYRIKDPEHLIDKIIRKKVYENKVVTKDSFLDEFDDFIGFRILHLFKNDWESIYNTLKSNYEAKEKPVAYHRNGDDPSFIQKCLDLGLEPKVKEAGYRSIHFIALFPFFSGGQFKCEIQIRTLFEEAWSEIDHLIRYPNNTDSELMNNYLLLFNKLAGYADDMGTFLIAMKSNLIQQQMERNELETVIEDLKSEISGLKVTNKKQKDRINELMNKLDEGVTARWPLFSSFSSPSALDYISEIQSPSGITGLNSVARLHNNLGSLDLNSMSGINLADYYARDAKDSEIPGINSLKSLLADYPEDGLIKDKNPKNNK